MGPSRLLLGSSGLLISHIGLPFDSYCSSRTPIWSEWTPNGYSHGVLVDSYWVLVESKWVLVDSLWDLVDSYWVLVES